LPNKAYGQGKWHNVASHRHCHRGANQWQSGISAKALGIAGALAAHAGTRAAGYDISIDIGAETVSASLAKQ